MPAEVEVQAQATFVMRLYQAVSIDDPQWRPPRFRLAETRDLGEPLRSEATLGGRRYRVTERRYAVFPYASGALVARDAHVEAGFFDSASGGFVRRRVDAPPVTLRVRPLPEAAGSDWLPARSVEIEERWDAPGVPGGAYRRTIRVEARGVDAARIVVPEVAGEGFVANLERTDRGNRVEGGVNVGVAETIWRIVQRQEGPLIVPEWYLDWWDASEQRGRRATLPPRRFDQMSSARTVDTGLADDMRVQPAAVHSAGDGRGRTISVALVLGLGLLGVIVGQRWWRANIGWRNLRRACLRNDAAAARDALRVLPRPARNHGLTPAAIARRCVDPDMRMELRMLDSACYGRSQRWRGGILRRMLPRLRRLLREAKSKAE